MIKYIVQVTIDVDSYNNEKNLYTGKRQYPKIKGWDEKSPLYYAGARYKRLTPEIGMATQYKKEKDAINNCTTTRGEPLYPIIHKRVVAVEADPKPIMVVYGLEGITPNLTSCDCGVRDGHGYVEIGGIKWATMNIGAKKVTDAGLYFQWGDTQGYTASQCGSGEGQKYFGLGEYKFSDVYTKYNKRDGIDKLMPCDDAVTAAWGKGWRMPTREEFGILCDAAHRAWVTNYKGSGVSGMLFVDKTDDSKKLFLPTTGYCCNGGTGGVGSFGDYWSSSLNGNIVDAYHLYLGDVEVSWRLGVSRYYGFPVRGVVAE